MHNLVFLFNPALLTVTFQLNSSKTHSVELGTNSRNQHEHHAVLSEPEHWLSKIFSNRSTQAMIMLRESLDGRTSFSQNSLSHVRGRRICIYDLWFAGIYHRMENSCVFRKAVHSVAFLRSSNVKPKASCWKWHC